MCFGHRLHPIRLREVYLSHETRYPSACSYTFNQELLLMATLAQLAPNLVLHNVMPIFIFMESNVFHRDNSYSFKVVQKALNSPSAEYCYSSTSLKTVDSIVPVMVSSLKVPIRHSWIFTLHPETSSESSPMLPVIYRAIVAQGLFSQRIYYQYKYSICTVSLVTWSMCWVQLISFLRSVCFWWRKWPTTLCGTIKLGPLLIPFFCDIVVQCVALFQEDVEGKFSVVLEG